MAERSKLRTDADNAFLRTQTQSSVRDRIVSETEMVNQARDAKTAKLKAQRLEKEALDREMLAANPPKPKKRQAASPAPTTAPRPRS
ncbi:hypothetical protein DWF00_14565 [Bosea caraganae]|uniref:Uncharacterized protein n=1 Tax=Bosea caraganae TaxID=2763117 RepID=A0A370KYF9_9HYPH|nr:hypothetical protein [Bosea caraganae]RDJ20025.1 hypothetical protein DWE98_26450 [Bosea caraganae]RDJ25632.1 hypothetical protein DWF00_14565 [Bosea caraganae]